MSLALGGSLQAIQLPIRNFTASDGMPRDLAECIVQDSRGFLWLCTSDGLSRFDGYQFVNYGPEQGLPNRMVHAFLQTAGGSFLVATSEGVSRLDPDAPSASPHKFRALPFGGRSRGVFSMVQDCQGVVWGGAIGGVFRIEKPDGPATVLQFVSIDLPPETAVYSLALDAEGSLWMGTAVGLCRRRPNGRIEWVNSQQAGFPREGINALQVGRDGRLWAGTLHGLWRFHLAPYTGDALVERVFGVRDGLASARIHALFQSIAGTIWVGTAASLSEFLGDGAGRDSFRSFNSAQGLRGRAVLAIHEDSAGNLWVAGDHGLARIAHGGFVTYTEAEGIGTLAIAAAFQTRDGNRFAVSNQTRGLVIHQFKAGRFSSILPRYPANLRNFGWGWGQIVRVDRAGDWWIATGEGLLRFRNVRSAEELGNSPPANVYTTRDGLAGDDVFRIFEDSRGDIWVSAPGGGPRRWERATGRFHRYPDSEFPGFATAFAEDRAGNLWIGLSGIAENGRPSGVVRYRNGRFQRFLNTDSLKGWIGSLLLDHAGRMWIGSGEGLGRIDEPNAGNPRIINYSVPGLTMHGVRALAEDRWGRIYVGSGRGLDRFDPNTGQFKHFSASEGFPGGSPATLEFDREGVLWAGTSAGLAMLTPELETPGLPPPVYITAFSVNGEPLPIPEPRAGLASRLRLPPEQNQVQIEFVGPSAVGGDILRYQYRLKGGGAWSELSGQRTVHFATLSAGQYRFQVRAVTPAGVESAQAAEAAFEILPPVWRRWWFLAIAAAALSGLALGVHRYRLSRQLELERIRTRIAADLHDDLGASLSRVAILSEILKRGSLDSADSGRRLTEIADTARGMVDGMSDIVWSIDPRRDDMRSLVRRVRQFAGDVLESQGIRWTLVVDPETEKLALSADQRRNLFLIFKEAIVNSARHARCTSVELGIQVRRGECLAFMRDNGQGIHPHPREAGNGLANMSARAAALRGDLKIGSPPENGTQITLRFPLARHSMA